MESWNTLNVFSSHTKRRLCVVQNARGRVSETFLRAQSARLPADVLVLYGALQQEQFPNDGRQLIRRSSPLARTARLIRRMGAGRSWDWQEEITETYVDFFRRTKTEVVLAQYGPTGVAVMDACRRSGVPLVVHFHGFDASRNDILESYSHRYAKLFTAAAAIVVVSHAMHAQLRRLGADAAKLFWNPCGVDCRTFEGARPQEAKCVFLAVGSMVGKKALHLTILAFADVLRECSHARLRIVGDGPLRPACEDLADVLGIRHAVTFLGARSHDVVAQEMRQARAFVQHSVRAYDGDCEGTPVAILEAGATGLPVVSTRHAGIPDVVLHEETGLLVDERDVQGMAREMLRLARDPSLAERLGRCAQKRVRAEFDLNTRIARLWSILQYAMDGGAPPATHKPHDSESPLLASV